MCFSFPQSEERLFKEGLKFITFRPTTHRAKGGKRYTLQSKRVKGGFGSAFVHKPFIYDIRCLNDEVAQFLGYETKEEYLNQPYNKNNPSYLRKAYVITDFEPNKGGN